MGTERGITRRRFMAWGACSTALWLGGCADDLTATRSLLTRPPLPDAGPGPVLPTTAAIQAMLDAAPMNGRVTLSIPGVYRLTPEGSIDQFGAPKRYCLTIRRPFLTFEIGAGVVLQLADDVNEPGLGAIDLISWRDQRGITITGAGTLDGNAWRQPRWTAGYGQSAVGGAGISQDASSGGGNHDILVEGITVRNCFGASVNLENAADGRGTNQRIRSVATYDCGEGQQIDCADGASVIGARIFDAGRVGVGDGVEVSNSTDFLIDETIIVGGGGGAAFDVGGSQRGTISHFDVTDYAGGFDGSTTAKNGVCDDITVQDGIFRQVRSTVILPPHGRSTFARIAIDAAPGIVAIATGGPATDAPVHLSAITITNQTVHALQCAESRAVIVEHLAVSGPAADSIVVVANSDADRPTITITDATLSGALIIADQGHPFAPNLHLTRVTGTALQSDTPAALANVQVESCQWQMPG